MGRPILVSTPLHHCDPDLAIAASQAGELGLLTLAAGICDRGHKAAFDRMRSTLGRAPNWGVLWWARGEPDTSCAALGEVAQGQLPYLVIAGVFSVHSEDLAAWLKAGRQRGQNVILEVYSLEQADAAVAVGFDGLVLKGAEAGGWVGQLSAFMWLQAAQGCWEIPWWVQGGWGEDVAAACFALGGTPALAEELWLTWESPLAAVERRLVASSDGTETTTVAGGGHTLRIARRLAQPAAEELVEAAAGEQDPLALFWHAWEKVGGAEGSPPVPMGQGIGQAHRLAERYVSTAGVLQALRQGAKRRLRLAAGQRALKAEGDLATRHGTRYPVVQGPMTRVSDTPQFARAVAGGGALPFLALGVMEGQELATKLDGIKKAAGTAPWGVGILGFLFPKLHQAQLALVARAAPQFAIVAGGRPSHAEELAAAGIEAYLHVPSPGLLGEYLAAGARKFVFEGQECGGHIGPLSSMALWQSAIEVLKEADLENPGEVQVLFAGGIHDSNSAAMVGVLAADLVEMGMAVGVLMGTAYLFTEEAVASGAITPGFQQVAIDCRATACLESAPGQVTRCAETEFVAEFRRRRADLHAAQMPATERRHQLELLNLGRLRLAAKGQRRASEADVLPGADGTVADRALKAVENAAKGALEDVDEAQQRRDGLYMLGDVALLENRVQSIAQLHRKVSDDAVGQIEQLATKLEPEIPRPTEAAGEPIAIVGMSSLFPGAGGLEAYWEILVNGQDQVRDVPADRWAKELYFAPGGQSHDRTYAQRGCFLDPIRFDPIKYNIPPAVMPSVEPVQFLAVDLAARALADAGYERRSFDRSRVAVVFGAAGMQEVGIGYSFRTMARQYLAQAEGLSQTERHRVMGALANLCPAWTEDSFPGILSNVISGRVANRLDLNGPNFSVDAACASSLAALKTSVEQLRARSCDMALVGGVDWTNHAFTFLCFAKTHALTGGQVARPFDAAADGIVLGEGAGVLVLKRLADARRDGDRIWAVLRGIGGTSDGGSRSLTAPDADGQVLALERAYVDAGIEPSTVGLVEAHATGTRVGDREEVAALQRVFGQDGRDFPVCAIGSVKSMIGHTKAAAGMAGLIKAVLALRHRVLPPTANIETPTGEIDWDNSPFFLNAVPRPWIQGGEQPARAGVSAFGFGGANFHAVLEEYRGAGARPYDRTRRSAQVFLWQRADKRALVECLGQLGQALAGAPESACLEQLAYSVYAEEYQRRAAAGTAEKIVRLGLVAADLEDLRHKLDRAIGLLDSEEPGQNSGIFFSDEPAATPEEVCFLYPGQGAQKVGMLAELLQFSPFGTEHFEAADRRVADFLPQPLSNYIFPPTAFDQTAKKGQEERLRETQVAQPALVVGASFAHRVLAEFGLQPARVGGHSLGEYVALWAAGVYGLDDLWWLLAKRGQIIGREVGNSDGGMVAVSAGEEAVRQVLSEMEDAPHIANLNAPEQTILSGSNEALKKTVATLRARKIASRRVNVSGPFHSPAMEPCLEPLTRSWEQIETRAPDMPVYSNVTAELHPADARQIGASMSRHLADTVRFVEQIRHMHRDGGRVFFEVGPGRSLCGLVGRILADKPHVAIPLDQAGGDAWEGLAKTLAQAAVLGLDIDLAAWFRERNVQALSPEQYLDAERRRQAGRPTDWWLTGKGGRPVVEGNLPRPEEPVPDVFTDFEGEDEETAAALQKTPAQENENDGEAEAMVHTTVVRANENGATKMERNDAESNLDRLEQAPVAGGAAQVEAFQQTMSQWLELQSQHLSHQQSLHERFLALQERVYSGAGGSAAGADPAPVNSQTGASNGSPAPVVSDEPVEVEEEAIVSEALGKASGPPASQAPEFSLPDEESDGPTDEVVSGQEGKPSVEEFRRDLLAEVSQRTGYPVDMLEMDAPLEAGMGIDSIKILETFSALKRYHPYFQVEGEDEEEMVARFAQLTTLNAIIGAYEENIQKAVEGGGADPSVDGSVLPGASSDNEPTLSSNGAPQDGPVARYRLRTVLVSAPEMVAELPFAQDEAVLVLGGGELAAEVAAATRTDGNQVFQVEQDTEFKRVEENRFTADLANPADIEQVYQVLAERHRVGTIVNLLGIDGSDASEWGERSLALTLALANVARVFAADLEESAKGGLLLNLTSLGGRFGIGSRTPLPISQAGSIGLTKALGREWKNVRVRNLDLPAGVDTQLLASGVLAEAAASDKAVEIGWDQTGRWKLSLVSSSSRSDGPLPIDRDAVVLVTGGGYGIGAVAARALAAEVPATFVLVGRTPLTSPDSEPESVCDVHDEGELRRALLDELGQTDSAPSQVEEQLRQLRRQRALRQTVAELEATGAVVDYRAVDVQDDAAFAALIEQLYERYGRLDGAIHAAGAIADGPLATKTTESFRQVFEPKVHGALTLARSLRPEALKFLVFFSSLSGRLGNAMQTDYSAANETLNKLAQSLAASWPGRIVALNWGPWDSGLVPEGLKKAYAERGIRLISEAAGGRALVDELRQSPDSGAEIVLTCSPEQILADVSIEEGQ
ncbi:MAG: SDR family NAD(P)-dependent oxidoreductase [Candidatus Latescibacteria bacterium]|nr:SDR family NAD(P)-dependent oxidoreductase [Candidatus Latescibacterota bacterium]